MALLAMIDFVHAVWSLIGAKETCSFVVEFMAVVSRYEQNHAFAEAGSDGGVTSAAAGELAGAGCFFDPSFMRIV